MFYFILWVLFMLAVIVAVPVVNAIENKRRRALLPDEPEEAEVDEELDEEPAEGGFGEAEEAGEPAEVGSEFGGDDELGGDDFSAFDDEFK